MAVVSEIAQIYRASKKKKDINLWTEWVCRPPAAVVVYALRSTRVTPNQVTFFATFLAFVSAAMFIACPGWWGAVAAALVFEVSFVFDCVDGQLARIRKTASPIGHHRGEEGHLVGGDRRGPQRVDEDGGRRPADPFGPQVDVLLLLGGAVDRGDLAHQVQASITPVPPAD